MKIFWYRKTPYGFTIKLGRWWQIAIARDLVEDFGSQDYDKGFVRRIREGCLVPFWYGYAYSIFDTDTRVYMPIPINIVRAFWQVVKMRVLMRIKYTWPLWIVKHAHRRQR